MGYKLDEAIQIFESIKNVSGRIEKEKILKENKNHSLFRSMLDFLYNPFITTGLSDKKMSKDVGAKFDPEPCSWAISNITEAMNYLKKNNTGKDKDIKAIQEYIMNISQPPRHKEFLELFFTKEYKCGITSKTINKVYGKGTIPKFEIMLAENLEDYLDYIDGEEHIAMMKYDGVRCTAVKEDGVITFFTRKGHPILGLVELEEEFKYLPDNVYEGELVVSEFEKLVSKECYKRSSKKVRTDGDKTGLVFIMFDVIPVEEFNNGVSKDGYSDRLKKVHDTILYYIKESDKQLITQPFVFYRGTDINLALKKSEEVIARGQEGVVVRKSDAPYVGKRSKDLLRIKGIKTADLRVVGYEEGTKESTKGKLGALVVNYKGFNVKVGSGYKTKGTDERQELWDMRDDMIGKIIEVYYSEETSNDKGGLSLRFPRFKGVRWDKDKADFEETIK